MRVFVLIIALKSGERKYIGPFQTWFRANEYGLGLRAQPDYIGHQVSEMTLPSFLRARFK